MQQFTLTLLRHGETLTPKNLNGATDVALCEEGYLQMLNAVNNLSDIERIVSSPLQRCAKVAQQLSQQWQIPLTLDSNIQEMNFGDWDGQPVEQLYQKNPELMAAFWNNPLAVEVPNGEQVQHFYERIDDAWHHQLKSQKNTLLICHAGVIRYLIAKVLTIPIESNAHINALQLDFAAVVHIKIFLDDAGDYWPRLVWPTKSLA